ncbi:hypothetical protein HMPREF2865_10885 [Neisseria sp. HMSC073G10]|jgi:restriction modification system, specificity subunit|uniref:restriction endonuclease subunit S n=1 Tax=Neisseria sp. HMSC073G10 TaxID=1739369 RepID=UPI0008A3DC81|nr:restriction endonuclease subunit S [Neisseria sp. HMSC073G10]OFR82636.1 hypothetical protein HMPREF2865_10885 [Neisseria sp. HMSC073G10]
MNKQQEPRLRFNGFTDAWEEKVLGEVTEYLSDGTHFSPKSQNGEYKYITSKNIRNSGLDLSDVSYISAEEHQEIYKRCSVKFGDLLLTKDGASTGNCCINFLDEEFSLLSSVAVLRPKQKKHNANFLCQVLQSPIGQNEIKGSMAGQAITRITLEKLRAYKFNFPLYEEQTHLGLFFRRLDSLIAESQAVLEKSRQLKKAMLAKMFPANGEKIPKIRFKGFEGEWERNELGCLGYCLSGIGFSENEQGGENGIPFFKVSDMNLSGNEVYLRKANNYVTQEQIDKQRWQVIQQLPCIFFAKVGAALLLNRKRLVNTPFLLDNNTMAFILDSSLDNYFMKTLFDTIDLPALAQIGALPSINAKDIEKNIVFIPTPKEQTAIGNFFRQLDETIALQSAEVEKLNQLKKGLLAAMLV